MIDKWLDYRTDTVLNFFAHYAALQLIIEGSNISGLIDIINEMFSTIDEFHFKLLLDHIFNSGDVDLTVLRQILITFVRNVRYHLKISVRIDRKEILELILNLELEQIISNKDRPSTRSYLLQL